MPYTDPLRAWLSLFALLLLCMANTARADADAKRVLVLISNDAAPYQETLAGFRDFFERSGQKVEIQTQPLHNDAGKAEPLLARAREQHVALILTLGALATQSALRLAPEVPVVAGLVVSADDLNKAPNTTGVVLELPLDVEVMWLQRMLPSQKNIGLLFNPAQNQAHIDTATKLLTARGLTAYPRAVDAPKDLPDALENLTNHADVLWGIADPVVYAPQTAKPILLFSFRNRIPVVGLSSAWVKAGALYALDRDYFDIGAQCGELARKILSGTPASKLPAERPRKIVYTINLKTARYMKLDIPASLVQGAREVFD
jgi:putative tryptophan/tyrosine transport system substrate-binding protein